MKCSAATAAERIAVNPMTDVSANPPPSMNWGELFPDEDYRFRVGVKPGNAAQFFAATAAHDTLIAQRAHWLAEAPRRYAALLPEGDALLGETVSRAQSWGAKQAPGEDSWTQCLALGRMWEPDYLLLKPDANGAPRLLGGCVCFPSSWSLEEKMGRPIEFIHGVVPGLNASSGQSITSFLTRMKPGSAWTRANWGLSRSAELNQHPERKLPRLTPPLRREEVWLRVEHQILLPLPQSGGILFGIRLAVQPLAEVVSDTTARAGLRRALETMPEEVAVYKGLAAGRADLLRISAS